jgi:hypothetical protein
VRKQDIFRKLFPSPKATFNGRGGDEINGLDKNTVPNNCTILARGLAKTHGLGRQEHFLVEVDDTLVYTRVCAAMKGSAYDEFAVVLGLAVLDEDKQQLTERATRFIELCCQPA